MMRTSHYTADGQMFFALSGVEPAYREAVRALAFAPGPVDGDFTRGFPADAPHIERIYATFARDIEAMVAQTARVQHVPWERALDEFLRLVAPHGIDWWLCGSAALAARGLDVAPRDLDLVVAGADAPQLGDILLNYLIEPVVPVQGWFCDWFGRAFIGARVEWVGGVDGRADTPHVSDFGPTAAACLDTVTWRGHTLRVPPLDLQLQVSERRGLTGRVAEIERVLRSSP
jgi:hypothetical protein